jgi:hypothetical protein
MRFMIIIKATQQSEAGVMPSAQLLAEMGQFNEKLVQAGVMLAGEGLHPTSRGARVRFSGDQRTVIDGPFAETKELIAGFWLWQVASKEEAIEWVKQCPNPHGGDCEIEIRQVFEAEDFGAALTPDLRAQEERLRPQLGQQPECVGGEAWTHPWRPCAGSSMDTSFGMRPAPTRQQRAVHLGGREPPAGHTRPLAATARSLCIMERSHP